ncbi:nucleotide exchange factor GrpE [Winogradskyella aurantiaca]|uniref:nucleotide exchange factor GrpE n=1 Tax=Winogradskyella aurantiaca TaxID=2219558 RepID=UPI000E1CC494|nr:nucleotide exchange factor GrpE [Winogradskyella aurantiaca]
MSKKTKTKAQEEVAVEDQINDTQEQVTEPKEESTISETEQLQNDLANEKDKFMRLFAEFENYKKRTSKERVELFKTAGQDVMTSLLPILDDFERALNHINEDKEAEELRKGVELIYNKLKATLEQKGLSKIEVNQGDVFNADDHEAVTQIPAPSEDLKGKIIDVIEVGYQLGNKVLRFPKVVVGQ